MWREKKIKGEVTVSQDQSVETLMVSPHSSSSSPPVFNKRRRNLQNGPGAATSRLAFWIAAGAILDEMTLWRRVRATSDRPLRVPVLLCVFFYDCAALMAFLFTFFPLWNWNQVIGFLCEKSIETKRRLAAHNASLTPPFHLPTQKWIICLNRTRVFVCLSACVLHSINWRISRSFLFLRAVNSLIFEK